MAKQPKPRYFALVEPQPGLIRQPPEKVTRREESVLLANQLKFAIRQAAAMLANDATANDALSDLRRGLIDLVLTSDVELNHAVAAVIEEFTLLGYAGGYVEADAGVAMPGRTECHIAFALLLLSVEAWAERGRDNGRLALLDYSLQSGYVRYRSGPAGVSRLLSTARDHKNRIIVDA